MSQKSLTYQEAIQYLASIKDGSLPSLNGKKVRSSTKYIAGLSTGLSANNGELVIASTVPAVGVTNFPKGNILPKGTNWLVIGVRMLFDTTTSVTTATALWANVAPVVWKNGELTISQKGEGILFDTSVTDVTNFKASTGNDVDFREVVPFVIREEANYSLKAQLAGTASADQAYKLELRVIEFVDADKA